MNQDILSTIRTHSAGRIRLAGSVSGIPDCELVADADCLVIGSGIECDLAVPDPLFPRRAFVIRRDKCHAGTDQPCRCVWTLESPATSRVFVNNRLTHKEKLIFGDSIAMGCHRFSFTKAPDAPRNQRSNVNVGDLCARLMTPRHVPAGFLAKSPLYGYYLRRQKAMLIIACLTALLAIVVLMTPRQEAFTPIQDAMDVVMVADVAAMPEPDAVRPLSQVARKSVTDPALEETRPELQTQPASASEPLLVQPAMQMTVSAPEPTALKPVAADASAPIQPLVLAGQAAPEIDREPARLAQIGAARRQTVQDPTAAAGATLGEEQVKVAALDTAVRAVSAETALAEPTVDKQGLRVQPVVTAGRALAVAAPAMAVARPAGRLGMTAPVRRLSVAEAAAETQTPRTLGAYAARLDPNLPASKSFRTAVSTAAAEPAKPSSAALEEGRAQRLNQVAAYTPSPVQFETIAGETIPVARIAEQLAELKGSAAGPEEIKIDGTVTEAEIAASWKSGQLRIHAPGKPPPLGNPPTFCYVTKKDLNGRPCLYVSFVCMDPQLDKLVVRGNREIPAQDSVEIYLDVKGNRNHYYQLMVNSHGDFEGHDHPNPRTHNPWRGVAPVIKTSINREAGQWTCEVLIPFDQLGGVPSKGTRWPVNFVRNFRGQPETRGPSQPGSQVQTWFEVYDQKSNLHQPGLFGVFQW